MIASFFFAVPAAKLFVLANSVLAPSVLLQPGIGRRLFKIAYADDPVTTRTLAARRVASLTQEPRHLKVHGAQ